MGLSPISGDAASYKLPTSPVPAMATRDGALKNAAIAAQVQQAHSKDATVDSKPVAPAKVPVVATTKNAATSGRSMRHIVESYNPQGKVRIKFLDSNNNTIYQIPTEMVAKTEDLMSKTELTANVTA